jgi:HEAT repeat protein
MPDLSLVQLPDLSHVQLPDLSHIQLPDLSHVHIPDLSHLELPNFSSGDLSWQQPFPQPAPAPGSIGVGVGVGIGVGPQSREQLDNVYDQARSMIERNQYDRAIDAFNRVISGNGSQMPGAMYWKAYSLARVDRRPDALTTLAELRKQFPKSAWINDAQALELEVKQASGQSVSADTQNDDELKLLALRGLMQSDPEAALPVIEKLLSGPSSVRIKDRALYTVSQSRSTRGRALLVGVAKGNGNPDLQLKAIRYIGQMGGPESSQALDDAYRATSEERVKREIIRSLGSANARDRLLALAKGETSADLRGEAVRQLGNMNATTELSAIARAETDPGVRRSAIRALGNTRGAAATDTLVALYASEQSDDNKKSIIEALGNGDRAAALVTLARGEKNPTLKASIVQRLGNMRDPAARDYLLEILAK